MCVPLNFEPSHPSSTNLEVSHTYLFGSLTASLTIKNNLNMATFKIIPLEQYEERIAHFVNSLRAYRTIKRNDIKLKDFNVYYFFFRTSVSLELEHRIPFFVPSILNRLLDIDYPFAGKMECTFAFLPLLYKSEKERKYNIDIMVFYDKQKALSIYKQKISSIYGKH